MSVSSFTSPFVSSVYNSTRNFSSYMGLSFLGQIIDINPPTGILLLLLYFVSEDPGSWMSFVSCSFGSAADAFFPGDG